MIETLWGNWILLMVLKLSAGLDISWWGVNTPLIIIFVLAVINTALSYKVEQENKQSEDRIKEMLNDLKKKEWYK